MNIVISQEAIHMIENFNKDFEKQNGYTFGRCWPCVLPSLIEVFLNNKGKLLVDKLSIAVQEINNDYLNCADYKMEACKKSGLRCGYDCIYYENVLEACPLAFWEIDKSNLFLLIDLLDKLVSSNIIQY